MPPRLLTCLLAGPLLLGSQPSWSTAPDATPNNGLPQYLEQARRTFNVPGLAVGIVKDGQVVFEQGLGARSLEDHRPVSVHTQFCIASNTKSFTGTALEILADEGKLHLEDRVVDHLPWFRMGEPYVTREMRLRDILAHRSGLGSHAGDLLFVTPSTYTTREVVERLGNVPLKSGFRATFAYENLMYAVAALVIESASGESYADFVREHLFTPAGMSESHIDATELQAADDVATPYALRDGKLTALPPLVWKNNPGAAGIYSTVHDMTRWAQAQLAHRLLSTASQQRMWSIITPIDIDPAPIPELQPAQPNFLGYAEGWYVSGYAGQRLVWHTGEFPGMFSQVTLVPALNLGIVILTNQEADGIRDAITFHVLDTYLGRNTDWIAAYAKAVAIESRHLTEALRNQPAPPPDSAPTKPLSSYTGIYRDPWYGDVEVSVLHGELRMRFTASPRLRGSLRPWGADTFLARWDDRLLDADALVRFTADPRGRINGASLQRASPETSHAYDYQDLHLVRTRVTQ